MVQFRVAVAVGAGPVNDLAGFAGSPWATPEMVPTAEATAARAAQSDGLML